jgi:serine/threonine-protein kinase
VAAAVAHALEKVPADRFASAREFAEALGNPSFTTRMAAVGLRGSQPPPTRIARLAIPLAVALLLALATGAWGWLRRPWSAGVARYGLAFPPGQELFDGAGQSFALAPDGSWIVYDGPGPSGGHQLWVKRRDAYRAVPLAGTEHERASAPTVSPDGKWIVFTSAAELRKVPREGGSAITLADSVSGVRGVAWLDDGSIIYRDVRNRLRRVPDTGGASTVVWSPGTGSGSVPRLPTALPGARGILLALCRDTACSPGGIALLDLASGKTRDLVPDGVEAWYIPTGQLIYIRRDGGVFAAPFDLKRGALTGPSVPLLAGVQVQNYTPDFALSASGSMLMIAGPAGRVAGDLTEAVWVTRDGVTAPVDTAWRFLTGGNSGRALSPDGKRLALTILAETGNDIWVKDLDRGPLSRLTGDPGPEFRPRWTPDGRSVLFISSSSMLLRRRADGTLPADTLLRLPEPIFEAQWSRDSAWIVVRVGGQDGQRDIWAQQVGRDSTAHRLLASDFDENAMGLSPDGRWIAYQSTETGATEVFVRPFPDVSAGKWTVSLGGGSQPVWAHSGRELFYVDDRQTLVAARVHATAPATFEVLERKLLFSTVPFVMGAAYSAYDVAPGDQRFLMIRRVGATDSVRSALVLTENWFQELRAGTGR